MITIKKIEKEEVTKYIMPEQVCGIRIEYLLKLQEIAKIRGYKNAEEFIDFLEGEK